MNRRKGYTGSFLLGCGRSIFREGGGRGCGGGADCDIMMLLYDIYWHKSCLRAIIKGATWHDSILVIPTTLSHLPYGKTAA